MTLDRTARPGPAGTATPRLLLVSPDASLAERLRGQLGQEHEVHAFDSLPDGLETLRPDLVVIDLECADTATLERLATLRDHPELGATPVLFLAGDETAVEIAAAAGRASQGNGRHHLLEPQLLQRARELLSEARRRLEGRGRDLRRAEAERRVLVETTADAVVTIDADGRIRSFNSAAQDLFGYSEDEILGENVGRLMPEDEARRHPGHVRRYLETGERRILSVGREVEAMHRDGHPIPVHLWVNEVRLDDEVLFIGFVRDLSAQKRLRQEYLQAQKLESIGRLAGGMAHDFNNLLTGIEGGLRMSLEAVGADHDAAGLLEELRAETLRGASMVRQLLRFSRRTPTATGSVDVIRVLREAEPILGRLLGEDVRVRVEHDPDLPAVQADPALLEQALLNLAVNARDAMPEGGKLEIVARCEGASASRNAWTGTSPDTSQRVVLEVRDDGVGMDGATLARAREPFFTTKDPSRGTGLGLSTVDELLREWGGAVELESQPGQGTTVRLLLPVMETGRQEAPPTTAHAGDGRSQGVRILVVEDEPLVRRALKHMLERSGHRVFLAADADEALAKLDEEPDGFDLLLTDVVLPGRGGPELARAAREVAPGLPALFMSAYSREELVERGRLPEDAISIEKPFRDAELLARVEQALVAR